MSNLIPELNQPQYIALRGRAKDITGQRFGRLTVLGPVGIRKQIEWLCQCECGNTTVTLGNYLRRGSTKSCGCFQQENRVSANTTHNLHDHPLYPTWQQIKNRCTKPNILDYPRYGGRGISICEKWQNDFQAFHDYVSTLEHCGEPGYTLDRINNDGNYEPDNVRWATRSEQMRNTRNTHMITHNGETKSLTTWAEQYGIGAIFLLKRLRRGWSIEDALSLPSGTRLLSRKSISPPPHQ